MRHWWLALCLLGCHAPARPAPAPASPAVLSAPRAQGTFEERVATGRLTYRFRASRFANLFYTVDCLAGTVHCTRDAFETLATQHLGGLDADDRKQLAAWKQLRRQYQGRIEKETSAPSQLPLPRAHTQIERRVRLAGYLASNLDEYAALATMLLDVSDVEHARAIVQHFEPRFDRYWQR